jgi:hypothetical protein
MLAYHWKNDLEIIIEEEEEDMGKRWWEEISVVFLILNFNPQWIITNVACVVGQSVSPFQNMGT